jgi:iron complex outermembrane receptor protein
MTVRLTTAFCGANLFALALAASAQAAPATMTAAAPAAAGNDEATLGEVVVTARRRSESLQEVPITVNAVTADTLQKLNLKQFSDIASVVPGLNLNTDPMAANNSASMRGVTFAVATGAEPTVALYMNDVPVQASFLFHSLYDVGQVEVLKGPQGTTRGISAPSGAITFTMRKPDLSDYGGYGDATVTDQGSRNFQGAINIPIIKDVLAIRAAGVVDHNRVDGVTSINSSLKPRALTTSERFSVSYEPSDIFNANVTYQHLDQDTTHFQQVSGPGHDGFSIGSVAYPASPAISPTDRLSVAQFPDQTKMRTDLVVGQIDSRIFGQHLSYVGSYMNQKTKSRQTGSSLLDLGNELPGVELKNSGPAFYKATTQEIRLASDPAPDRVFDYTLGAFYRWVETGGTFTSTGPLTAGAFGPYGATPVLADFDPRYVIRAATDYPGTLQETSLFGSATIHLDPNTELTGGVRHIWSINATNISINTLDAPINLGLPFPCSALQLGPQLPGFPAGSCSIPGQHIGTTNTRASETPTIYNISLSHHFTRDLLVYATTGTAFRPPTTTIGLQGALATTTDPTLASLIVHPSEHSRSYEVGFKSTWLDGRARLNAAIYRQKYSDLPIFVSNIPYFDTSSGQPSAFNFTASVDALVQGFDIDTAFQITHDWSVSLQGSYADGKIKGSLVPCSNPATPLSATHLVSLCPGGSSSTLPLWNASLQTEYTHPVTDNMDGFVRGLLTYYPENKRIEPGSGFAADKYSLMNLYLGVRAQDGSWEASIFARNIFDNKTATDVSPIEESLSNQLSLFYGPNNLFQNPALNLIHPTGYFSTAMTPPREVGVSFHYALGSR